MLRFSQMLHSKSYPKFEINEIHPKPLFLKFVNKGKLRKWAAYTDKYLIFKNQLKYQLQKKHDVIHVTDQSNSIYVPEIKKRSNATILVTCHDLIAIRQAKNEFKESPKVSNTGKVLQSWILDSLRNADYYACDSEQSLIDLNSLIPRSKKCSGVIHLGTNLQETKKEKNYARTDSSFNPEKENFIIHVGNAAWYKNRKAIFRTFKQAKGIIKDLKLVLVGPKPQSEELDDMLGLWLRKNHQEIIIFENICDSHLRNLYSYAKALIFPSIIEGFGWPPLEAAFCGCKVIASKTGAIFELLGDNATYIQPNDQRSINEAIIDVLTKDREKPKVDLPSEEDCRKDYYNLYSKLIKN